MNWELKSDRPIYTQLLEELKRRIVSGYYQPGDRLLPVRELAQEAKVNPNTMQKALSELERENLVFAVRTTGRYITEAETLIEEILTSSSMVSYSHKPFIHLPFHQILPMFYESELSLSYYRRIRK